ncbi:MXAN_2562 family outer membrane beta-barrel protein [Pendulispora albinea]|uniref:MXAN_2562 family outer membrane beta-barrel protein n=1 Tax=Pendulispora albinea TaxID=2741071 RepID=A0ABZ2M0I2_9BACT
MRLAPACAVLAFTAMGLVSTTASAGDDDAILRPRHRNYESPQNFALEFRFAPYKPQIDDEFKGTGKTPWRDAFGDSSRLLFAVEFDWQAIRIPYLGTLGPGVSIGYTTMSGPAKKLSDTGQITDTDSGTDTTLSVFPMYAVGVLRADVFMRELGIPLVPYGKAGVGYVPWRTYTEGGTSYRDSPDGSTTAYGKGQTWGAHFAAGLAFQMDVLDRRTAKNLDNQIGINHTYLYAEWMFASYKGIGQNNVLLVGTSTWVAGLSFEM